MSTPSSPKQQSLAEMRRRAASLGLPWADAWDRERLQPALERAERLQSMRVGELRAEAVRKSVRVGSKARKADWVTALLRAEFPARQSPPTVRGAPRRALAARLLQWSGALGIILFVLAALVVPVGAWRLSLAATAGLEVGGAWARQTAGTLQQSSQGLQSAANTLRSSNEALRSVGASLQDAQPLLASIEDVLGTQAPDAISTAHRSLVNAQSGAKSIDKVLSGLSFLGIGYNPEQPLAQGLADTADSLSPLPDALTEASGHLATTREDIGLVSQDVLGVSDDLADMSAQISPVAQDLGRQADSLDGLADRLDHAAGRISFWIWFGAGLAEFILIMGALSQYAVWLVGRREAGALG